MSGLHGRGIGERAGAGSEAVGRLVASGGTRFIQRCPKSSMVTAGVTAGIIGSINADGTVIELGKTAEISDQIAYQSIRALTDTVVKTAINGADLGDALKENIISSVASIASAQLAKQIGDLSNTDQWNLEEGDIRKVVMHAIAGCGVGQLSSQSCAAGAIGAGLQEVLGDQIDAMSDDEATRAQIAGLAGAIAVALTGGDAEEVNTASEIANAAWNYNRELHREEKQLNILLAEEMSKESGRTPFQERELLDRVSCQIVQCGATTGAIDPESQQYAEMIENLWDLYPKQMAVLAAASGVMTFENGQPVYSYTRMDQVFDNDVPIEAPGLVFGLATGGATGLLKVASKELAVLGKVIVRNMLDNPAAIGASGKTIAQNVAAAAKQAMQRISTGKENIDTINDFFTGAKYSQKVINQIKTGDYHAFPDSVLAFQEAGHVTKITGGDGVVRDMLKIPGEYRGKKGVFEFIKEADGTINHRLFKQNVE